MTTPPLTHDEIQRALHADLAKQRTAWLAGTRGEARLLGSLFTVLTKGPAPVGPAWWLSTSEHGMALHQMLDALGIIPDEIAPQCHPAEEPAQRLALMLERAEAFGRQRKVQRVVFSGWGPTAIGAALYCHARGGGGVWLRPPDPAGLIPRLRWEAGLERTLLALSPAIQVLQLAEPPLADFGEEPIDLAAEIPGLDARRPVVVIAILRREWGLFDDTVTRAVHALERAARAQSEWQFLTLSLLNALLERPFRTLAAPPENLLLVPPLPPAVFRALLARAGAVLTDSVLLAGEALRQDVPLAALGEESGSTIQAASGAAPMQSLTMPQLLEGFLGNWLGGLQAR